MAIKYKKAKELLEETYSSISENQEKFIDFLDGSRMMYKYEFFEQVLIYAQQPHTSACASYDFWAKRTKRHVRRGSRGIGLIQDGEKVRYVFDVSATAGGRIPWIWDMKTEYIDAAAERLGDGSRDFTGHMESRAKELAQEIIAVDEKFRKHRDFIEGTILYKILSRCNFSREEILQHVDLSGISDIDRETFINIGIETSTAARQELSEVKIIVADIEKGIASAEKMEYNTLKHKSNKREVQKNGITVQDGSRRDALSSDRSRTGGRYRQVWQNEGEIHEGTSEKGIQSHDVRRKLEGISDGYQPPGKRDAGYDNGADDEKGRRDGGTEEKRPDEMGADGQQDKTRSRADSDRGSDLQLKGQVYDVQKAHRDIPYLHKSELKKELLDKVPFFNGVDIRDLRKQFDSIEKCRKYRENGYLSSCFPDKAEVDTSFGTAGIVKYKNGILMYRGTEGSMESVSFEPWHNITSLIYANKLLDDIYSTPMKEYQQISMLPGESGDKHEKRFYISDEIIDHVIRSGSNIYQGKYRIYEHFNEVNDIKANIAFLKKEYGSGGHSPVLHGLDVSESHDSKGILLSNGYADDSVKKLITWNEAAQRINALIKNGLYLSQEETYSYQEWKEKRDNTPVPETTQTDIKMEEKTAPGAAEQDKLEIKIGFSEHPAFHKRVRNEDGSFDFIDRFTELPFSVANEFLGYLDMKQNRERDAADGELGYYHKTDFVIDAVIGGEEFHYEGRYDLGDGDNDLIEHIREDYKYQASDESLHGYWESQGDDYIQEQLDEVIKGFDVFLPFLEKHSALTDEDRKLLDEMKATEPEWFPALSDTAKDAIEEIYEKEEKQPQSDAAEETQPDEEPDQEIIEQADLSGASDYRTGNYGNDNKGFLPKEKFRQNIQAIQTLKQIESENRNATEEEQDILSRYVGWGGLADAFDSSKEDWKTEYEQLRSLLDDSEYDAARQSTLTAFYTPLEVTDGIYKVIGKMGLLKGRILEPSCGIGNFIGNRPLYTSGSQFYGTELDPISSRIACKLYPNAKILNMGFEEAEYPDDYFDLAVSNIPFGDFKLNDKRYDKENFLIHDYFFAKTLDKVKPGGVIAFVTSKGTLDKKNSRARRYIAERAELIGAVRLPNDVFSAAAGTQVTSDIIFLKKRETAEAIEPEWVRTGRGPHGYEINNYFIENPDMIAGELREVSGPYGPKLVCVSNDEKTLDMCLKHMLEAVLDTVPEAYDTYSEDIDDYEEVIPADPDVRNFSYTQINDAIYFRENSIMKKTDVSGARRERITGMIKLRDITRDIIRMQLEGYSDEDVKARQKNLEEAYDKFTSEYGIINSRGNKLAFKEDDSYPLLSSLEMLDDAGNLTGKADIFSKRTVAKYEPILHADTSADALAASLAEKGAADIEYMMRISGRSKSEIEADLEGQIYRIPQPEGISYQTADEFLSGNIRSKLEYMEVIAQQDHYYDNHVQALRDAMPEPLSAGDIDISLGCTWIDPGYIEDFMIEELKTPAYHFRYGDMKCMYSDATGVWNIKGKSVDTSTTVTLTYGTNRVNAYKLLEDALNLRATQIYDIYEEDGETVRRLNPKETAIARQKQDMLKERFRTWIWEDMDRREHLCDMYNKRFNSNVAREYDGSRLHFPGMNPEISLKPHQKDAVARQIFGGNTLLAHVVGAGKTFEMITACMEQNRIGLSKKAMFVVPNHLIDQWAAEFMRLYPAANVLATQKSDFTPANRKKFCSRIATGDYDAVIIGHSQFEKIPLSDERQKIFINSQLDEIMNELEQAKADRGETFTIKQLERQKKHLESQLKKFNDSTKKDSTVYFEELGIDRLFVDEAHNYKNLMLTTKMNNVAGVSTSAAYKSSDMFAKCRYIDEITDGKGITFATGTPVSNSMTELYTMQRYLQYDQLEETGLLHFDSWASTFGETVTSSEISPEGNSFRLKTRFARFHNLPELMTLFKEAADIKTADVLNLPVPEAEYIDVVLEPDETQKELISELGKRAEEVRKGNVDPSDDNMLRITTDGRKVALDERLIDESFEKNENGKAVACSRNIYEIWESTAEEKSTQLVFCDLSTPASKKDFNMYDEIKTCLVREGIPENEVAFIQDANTEAKKEALFSKVRRGDVRVLIGSTSTMGAGTNVQDRLIALHHIDVPWRPADIEQQEGRILRQGNRNEKVRIFRYITESTFDSYSWQIIENKQKSISQIMTSKAPARSCEDVDEAALSYAEVKALAAGDPAIKEIMELTTDVSRLKLLKTNYDNQRYSLENSIYKKYPASIESCKRRIQMLEQDIRMYGSCSSDDFEIQLNGRVITDRKEAGETILDIFSELKKDHITEPVQSGEFCGFKLSLYNESLFSKRYSAIIEGNMQYRVELSDSAAGNIARLRNVLDKLPDKCELERDKLSNLEKKLENAKRELEIPFAKQDELALKQKRLEELESLMEKKDLQSHEPDAPQETPEKKAACSICR